MAGFRKRSSWVEEYDKVVPFQLVVVECLVVKIRESKDIVGYKLNEKEVRISQYVDDSTILLDGIDSIPIVVNTNFNSEVQ